VASLRPNFPDGPNRNPQELLPPATADCALKRGGSARFVLPRVPTYYPDIRAGKKDRWIVGVALYNSRSSPPSVLARNKETTL
jgi:hypothetical protein